MQTQHQKKLIDFTNLDESLLTLNDYFKKTIIKNQVHALISYASTTFSPGSDVALFFHQEYIDYFLLSIDFLYQRFELNHKFFILLKNAIDEIIKIYEAKKKQLHDEKEIKNIDSIINEYCEKAVLLFKTASDMAEKTYYKESYGGLAKEYCDVADKISGVKGSIHNTEKIVSWYDREAKKCKTDFIKELLQRRACELRLQKAICDGDLQTTMTIIQKFSDLVDVKFGSGKRAIELAEDYHKTAIVKYLQKVKELPKIIDDLLEKIKPSSGDKSERLSALISLKNLVVSADGQAVLQQDANKKLEIIHLLELKIERDTANDVHDAAADLLIIVSPKLRSSVEARLSTTAKGDQSINPHEEKETSRHAPSPHQVMTAKKVIAQSQTNEKSNEPTSNNLLSPHSSSSIAKTSTASTDQFAVNMFAVQREAIATETSLSSQNFHHAKVESESESITTTPSSCLHFAGTLSIWSSSSSSASTFSTEHKLNPNFIVNI